MGCSGFKGAGFSGVVSLLKDCCGTFLVGDVGLTGPLFSVAFLFR